jgi:hypothetical protein
VQTGTDIKASWFGENFAIDPACLNDEAIPWTSASLLDGSSLPIGLVFNSMT